MTGELGQLALSLALVLSLIQAGAGLVGARPEAARARAVASGAAIGFFVFVALAFACLTYASRDERLLDPQRRAEFQHRQTAALQDHRRVGRSRRLHAPVDFRAGDLHRGHGVCEARRRTPDQCGAGRPGAPGPGLRALHPLHLQSVSAPRSAAVSGQWPQSAAAGSRLGLPSAHALHRLCRALGGVLLCRRRADHPAGRCRLGARGATLHAGGVDRLDAGHHAGLVVGLLRIGLGRLLVLGSGRECGADALASGHRAAAFGAGHRTHRRLPHLDAAARHRRLFVEPDRHLPGALGRAVFGPCLRQ